MSASEVEEVFTIESGSGLVDLSVITVSKDASNHVAAKIKSTLKDTSFLIFSEGLEPGRRLALAKIGPDFYHALKKEASLVYKLSSTAYLFTPQDSVDIETEAQFLLITLKCPPSVDDAIFRKQFEDILNFFATIVTEVPGSSPELDAVKRLYGLLDTTRLYPRIDPSEPIQGPTVQQPAQDEQREPGRSVPPRPPPPTQEPPSASTTTDRSSSPSTPAKTIAKGIVAGAEYVALGFNYGTQFAENLVHRGGEHLVQSETRHQRKEIDPKVITTLRTVRVGAEAASGVAETAVDKIAEQARKIGQTLVPHIEKHGTDLFAHVTGKDKEASNKHVKDILTVTASGLQGFSTIYTSITANAKQLAKAVAGETVNYVNKRYGDSAAEATQEAMFAAGHTATAVMATTELAPKAVAKKVVKEATKETIRTGGQC